MKISIITLLGTSLLTASSVFASRNGTVKLAPPLPLPLVLDDAIANSTVPTIPSENWAGAVLAAPPPGSNFTSVVGSFTVPDPTPPAGATSGTWGGSAWVGIDGWSTGGGLFQAGVAWTVTMDSSGSMVKEYRAWHEWVPNAETDLVGFNLTAGNTITVLCEAPSPSSGTCTIQNDDTGVRVSIPMSAPATPLTTGSRGASLIRQTVEWITEDFMTTELGTFIPFANFTQVQWTNCEAAAIGVSGNSTLLTPSDDGLMIVNLRQGGNFMTSTNVTGNQVITTYIGGKGSKGTL